MLNIKKQHTHTPVIKSFKKKEGGRYRRGRSSISINFTNLETDNVIRNNKILFNKVL